MLKEFLHIFVSLLQEHATVMTRFFLAYNMTCWLWFPTLLLALHDSSDWFKLTVYDQEHIHPREYQNTIHCSYFSVSTPAQSKSHREIKFLLNFTVSETSIKY